MTNKNSTIAIILTILTVLGIVAGSDTVQNMVATSLAAHPVVATLIVALVKIVLTLFQPKNLPPSVQG